MTTPEDDEQARTFDGGKYLLLPEAPCLNTVTITKHLSIIHSEEMQ